MKDLAEFDEMHDQDAELQTALRDFRSSVKAWSEAEYARPRKLPAPPHRLAWRRTLVWAMSLVMAAGVVGGGVYEHQRNEQTARAAEQKRLEQQRQLEVVKAREAEDLLAKIDSDIARQVPSAMEPLAQLMNDSQ